MDTHYTRGFGPLAIIIIAAIVVLAGGGIYYSAKKANTNQTMEEGTTTHSTTTSMHATTSAEVSAPGTQGTLRSLLSIGKDVVCTFNGYIGTKEAISGTTYISGTMMRGDFIIVSEDTDGNGDSHMIRTGDSVYVWSGTHGARMGLSEMERSTGSQTQTGVDLNEPIQYSCDNWQKDSSKFSVPEDIAFVDLSAMLKGNLKAMGALNTHQ